MRYDLAFFLCCCKSFLGSSPSKGSSEDYYELLEIERDASPDDIKRAFKRQSLLLHPDKIAQRGQKVTDADQHRFQKMKEAYEVLSDSHKRETYNAIGERGLKWLEEPFSVDPQEMAQNFAHSSTLDRSKIFGIFVAIAIIIFLLPILICLRVDGHMGHDARWIAVLTPLWIFNAVVLFYHFRVIRMGPINKPEDIPDNEWIDPLPMSKRYFSLFRFGLLCIFEVLAALRMDRIVRCVWAVVFIPIFVHEATTMYKKLPLARMKIVTVEDLETALGKQFSDFTSVEKELIARKYSVVPSSDSPEFETAHRLKARGRQDLIKVIVRLILVIIIITQLDDGIHWNWWLIFTPIWIMSFFMCALSFYKFNEAQNAIIRRDPQMFANMTGRAVDEEAASDEHAAANGGASSYGALEENDTGKQSAGAAEKRPELSDHEKEELKAQFLQAGYKLLGSCCSQAFLLLIVCLFVGKLEGAGYSAVWILSPFLFMTGIVLCCLGGTIFCITDIVDEVGPVKDAPPVHPEDTAFTSHAYQPPLVPHPVSTKVDDPSSEASWDPEKGQIWQKSVKENGSNSTILVPPSSGDFNNHTNTTASASVPHEALVDLISEPLIEGRKAKEGTSAATTAMADLD